MVIAQHVRVLSRDRAMAQLCSDWCLRYDYSHTCKTRIQVRFVSVKAERPLRSCDRRGGGILHDDNDNTYIIISKKPSRLRRARPKNRIASTE